VIGGLKVAVLVFVASILEVSVFSDVKILGGVPDLLLVTIVTVALLRGSVTGACAGFFAGLVVDTATLETLGLSSNADDLVGRLPLGWKQKLAFSVALLHEPKIVFLDEPTGGVDPITRRQFWELIYTAAARGTTVFVTTHYMDEAEYCDRISIMVDGRIAALGSPTELKEKFGADSVDDVFVRLARSATKGEAA